MSGATSHVMSRATCRGTRTRGVVEVVDDEPCDEPRAVSRHRTRGVGEVIDDEPARGEVVDDESRDKPRDVPKEPDAWRR
jgi:hypothetical protein